MSFGNVFIDTSGEMTFENQERLNFIMHFMKKGAVEQIKQKSDGTFIRDDAELSFSEIWLPCAKYQQSKIDELQKRIDKYQGLTKSIRAEFDLWSDDSEFAGIIEAQICMFERVKNEN